MAGKVDWMAAGLATLRADPSEPRALDVADREPLVCDPATPVGDLPRGRSVIVVNDHGIVLGRVPSHIDQLEGRSAEEIMRPGPATVRANEPLDPLLERMSARGVTEMIVTSPEGRLLGVIRHD